MADIALDFGLLKPRDISLGMGGYVIEGGRPMTGVPPQENDITGGGLWRATYNGIAIGSAAQHREWLKIMAFLTRAGNRLIVPLLTDITEPAGIAATTQGVLLMHAGTIDIDVSAGTLVEGTVFSISHTTKSHRAYIIDEIDSFAAGVYTVAIVPPLREDTADAVLCDFTNPRQMMRLKPGSDMDWRPWGNTWAEQNLDLIEAGW